MPYRGCRSHAPPNGKCYRVHTHTCARTHAQTCTRTSAQIAKDEEDLKKYQELLRQRELAREKEEAEHKAKLAAMEAVAQVCSPSLRPPPLSRNEKAPKKKAFPISLVSPPPPSLSPALLLSMLSMCVSAGETRQGARRRGEGCSAGSARSKTAPGEN